MDWKGQLNLENPEAESLPSELQFQNHLEKLLNPADEGILTDQIIEVKEVKEVIERKIKPNKSCIQVIARSVDCVFMFFVQHYLGGWLPFNMDFSKVENVI